MHSSAETPIAESTLLTLARAGDPVAFDALIERNRTRTLRICQRIVGNPHDAEDAYQDAALSAWQHITTFRGDAQFSSWLHRVAANSAHQILRRRKPDLDLVDFTDPDIPQVGTGRDFTAQIIARDALRDALTNLPDIFGTALVLREFGDLTIREIAQRQGVGEATVKTRLHRARNLARQQLAS